VKNAIQKGNHDGARIYAENAIREHQMEMQFMRLGSKLEGVASRLKMQEFIFITIFNLCIYIVP
jgi:charged multivesicular body protein 1